MTAEIEKVSKLDAAKRQLVEAIYQHALYRFRNDSAAA